MKICIKPKAVRKQVDGRVVVNYDVTDADNPLGGTEKVQADGLTVEELAASLAPKIKAMTEVFEERARLLAIAEGALKIARK